MGVMPGRVAASSVMSLPPDGVEDTQGCHGLGPSESHPPGHPGAAQPDMASAWPAQAAVTSSSAGPKHRRAHA